MEEAHKYVRENINTAMVRQKRYHDQKLSWQKFKPDDQVYVYFPIRKVGRSPKFTSYWQGPFKVLRKLTDLTYKVDCGQRGKPQVVHVDRLRLKRDQVLREEVVEEASSQVETNQSATSNVKADVISDEGSETDEVDNDVNLGATGGSRIRRQPKWLQDYVQW